MFNKFPWGMADIQTADHGQQTAWQPPILILNHPVMPVTEEVSHVDVRTRGSKLLTFAVLMVRHHGERLIFVSVKTDDFIRAIDLKTDKPSVRIRRREQTIAAAIVFDLAKQ